jgi:hypothetical protein
VRFERHQILALILGVAVLNGIFSPYLVLVLQLAPIWLPTWAPDEPSTVFYVASLITATTTLLVGGVPAAILERAMPVFADTIGSRLLWLIGCLVLSLPALIRLVGVATGG